MQSIDIFPWDDTFDTGLPEVDGQHRQLGRLLNLLASHVAFHTDLPEFEHILDELGAYAVSHFRAEEAIWHEYLAEDEHAVRHREGHQLFVRTIERLKSDRASGHAERVVQDALAFLTRWLVSHILETDRFLARVVLSMRAGMTLEAAKEHAAQDMSGVGRTLSDLILSVYGTLSANTVQLMRELSERRRLDRELRHRELLLRSVVETTADGFLLSDAAGRILEVNDHYCQLTGYDRDELLAMGMRDLEVADSPRELEYRLERIRRDGSALFETVHRTRAGEPLPIEASISFCPDGEGHFICFLRDMRERQRTLQSLAEESAKNLLLLRNASDGVHILDGDGTLLEASDSFCAMLGRSREEILGMKISEWDGHLTPDQIRANLRRLLQQPGRHQFETVHRRKDGSQFAVEVSGTALNLDGHPVLFTASRDISARKAAEVALRDSEARYRMLFERAGDAIFLMREGRFVDCNPATLDMFRVSREAIVGATPDQFSPERQPDGSLSRERARERIEAAMQCGTQLFEWRHLRPDGSAFDAEVRLSAVDIGGHTHVLANVRDVSARKATESELAQSRCELLESNEGLRLLNRLAQRLHRSLALEETLNETVQALLSLSHSPQVAVYLLDEGADRLRLAASHGFSDALVCQGSSLPLRGSLSGEALASGVPLLADDLARDNRVAAQVKGALVAEGAKSLMVLPLIWQGQPLGSINLIYRASHRFGQFEWETLVSLSNTVALAIVNSRHADRLSFQSRHDALTGLANRTLLHETFERWRGDGHPCAGGAALLLLDLDGFKEINDTLGHQVGDEVLKLIGPRLEQSCTGRCALIARLGGDEFAVLLGGSEAGTVARETADSVVRAMRRPFSVEGIEVHVGASVGVARWPEHGADSHALLRAADVAMYRAKRRCLGVAVYDRSYDGHSTERLALAGDLIQAIRAGELVLHYQPKVRVADGAVAGVEALVRWQHPRLGLLHPPSFLDLVEMSELIHPFTRAVFRLALADQRRLRDLGLRQTVAINLSARNLLDSGCFDYLREALDEFAVPAAEIELELTETALMQDPQRAAELLGRFVDLGVATAIDDFGTGYSSLSYLRRLPISTLKIDRTLVAEMAASDQDRRLVHFAVALAHDLDLTAVAEGVEDAETFDLLRAMGCDQAQGNGLCQPLPLEGLIDWLAAR